MINEDGAPLHFTIQNSPQNHAKYYFVPILSTAHIDMLNALALQFQC